MTTPDAAYWHNRGNALFLQKQLDEAADCFQNALRLRPDDVGILGNLGLVLRHLGRLDESIAVCRRTVQLQPDWAAAHINLSLSLTANKQFDEAIGHGRAAVRLRPDFAQAHHCLGYALLHHRHWEEAAAVLLTAVRLKPDLVEAQSNLGETFLHLHRYPEALTRFREAQRLRPELTESFVHQAHCLWRMGRFEDAAACTRELLRRKPDDPEGHELLGLIELKANRPAEALPHFDRALAIQSDLVGAHHYRGWALLRLGDYQRGWSELEWRWRSPDSAGKAGNWDGSPLAGRTILLRSEQGFGDNLQFVRFAPLVKARGATVILSCYPALVPLLSRCAGIDRIIEKNAVPPPCDFEVPLLSLPEKLGTTLETLPATVPYLFPDAALVDYWRRRLHDCPGFKIGIVWRGNPEQSDDFARSVALTQFAPLAREGVSLISLQQGAGREQLATVSWVRELEPRPEEPLWSFDDTAAVMKNLDLVVTVDTASSHLAGGLGVPVWVAPPFAADWRYPLGRDDSPWYPTMRLFRPERFGAWDEVFGRMAAELTKRPASR